MIISVILYWSLIYISLFSGDLWSYNAKLDAFVVSPEPDTYCYTIDISRNRCLILGTDGCWNMMNAQQVI